MRTQAKVLKPNTSTKADNRGNAPQTLKSSRLSEGDKIAAAVLAVVGMEPDDFGDIDDHPSSLDLPPRV